MPRLWTGRELSTRRGRGMGQDWGLVMRLASLGTSIGIRDRLARTLRRRGELVERGRDVAAQAAGAVRDAVPSRVAAPSSGGSGKQTAVAVAVVAVGVVAVGTFAYMWWRHRREQEYARLLEPEPESPAPAPAASPEGEPEAPPVPGPESPVGGIEANLDDATRESAVASPAEPSPPAEPVSEPVTAVRADGASGHVTPGATASAGDAPPQARRARALRPTIGASSGIRLPSAPAFNVPRTRTEIPSRGSISSLPG